MNRYFKLVCLSFALITLVGCSDDDSTVKMGDARASYTFLREGGAGVITFINTSENANSYVWDFGDGTTSTLKDPVKSFAVTGDYVVQLTATNTKNGTTSTFSSTISITVFQGGLVINGDFESGTTPWTFGVSDPLPPGLLVTEDGNTYYSINVAAAGNPFDVNLSQTGMTMTQGVTYRLTFDAWSDVNRSMVVGIGLSADPWTNQSVVRNLTPAVQSFSVDLVANFTSTNARVIFDLGAAVGRVNIDNVTLNPLP
jgi:PKD repeat protein